MFRRSLRLRERYRVSHGTKRCKNFYQSPFPIRLNYILTLRYDDLSYKSMDTTQNIHYRLAYRAAQARRQQALRHGGKSLAVMAFVALASAGILRISFLTYVHGQSGVSMFANELTRSATDLANRANAASTEFNSKVIATIEQAQRQVVARDLAIASSITTAGQETVALAAGSKSTVLTDATATPPKSNKPVDEGKTTATAQPSSEQLAETSATEVNGTATTSTPQSIAALPDFRSNSTPPTGKQTNATGGYAYGQCTYYVASKRQVGLRWGNARTWMSAAQREGYQTGKIPVPGAVAWTPNGWYGHVAYVERVEGEQVLISEMNFAGWNRVSQRWVNASSFGYIYGKS